MSSVFFHRFTVCAVNLCFTTQLSAELKLSVNQKAFQFTKTCSVSLFKALLSGQGNLSDSEKHSRQTHPPADQGDTPFTTARSFLLLHDHTLCVLKHELINFIWTGMLHLGYSPLLWFTGTVPVCVGPYGSCGMCVMSGRCLTCAVTITGRQETIGPLLHISCSGVDRVVCLCLLFWQPHVF